ncbi:hypothetical protein [Luteimonas terricola]|uniref:hypothetical protein n=1 Tax=Luteimonas terricola TaxID=645597 RepID=UPI0014043B26|nr:hypothetical protein [Luteimonas terricola]
MALQGALGDVRKSPLQGFDTQAVLAQAHRLDDRVPETEPMLGSSRTCRFTA